MEPGLGDAEGAKGRHSAEGWEQWITESLRVE